MRPFLFKTKCAAATSKLAKLFAKEIKHSRLKSKNAFIIGLSGALGTGKTTFTRGFARGLGIKRRLTSSTFLIIRNYELKIRNYEKLYHIDCYRIKKISELNILGFQEIIYNPKNIVLIEWADKIRSSLPKNTLWLKFAHGQKENERKITILPFDLCLEVASNITILK